MRPEQVIPISPIRVTWIVEVTQGCSPVATSGSTLKGENLTCDRHKQTNNGAVQQWCADRHLGMQNSSVLVMDGAIAADDHTGFHSYQLKTRRSGSSGHVITKTGQLRSGKTLSGTWQWVQITWPACAVPRTQHYSASLGWDGRAVRNINAPPSNLQ